MAGDLRAAMADLTEPFPKHARGLVATATLRTIRTMGCNSFEQAPLTKYCLRVAGKRPALELAAPGLLVVARQGAAGGLAAGGQHFGRCDGH
eukprot:3423978-Alexandrium_andersonii.AAC.1